MLQFSIVFVLILLNGVLAMSELAVLAAQRSRLRGMARMGRPGADAALALAEDPGRFLSTVQIGITLIGILAGAFSGVALGDHVATWMVGIGVPAAIAMPLGLGMVVVAVTYLSIVIGELAPKRLALRHAEQIACAMAPGMLRLTRITAPVGWLLDASTDLVFRLFGRAVPPDKTVTDEDVHALIAEAERSGTIETAERHMISRVLQLADRPVREFMTARAHVEWLDATADADDLRAALVRTRHSRLPVGEGSPDVILGMVKSREMLVALLVGQPLDLRRSARPAPIVPNTADALNVLAILQDAGMGLALVRDGHGGLEGIVTLTDLTKAIVGSFRTEGEPAEVTVPVRREDGSWLLAGCMPADEMAELLGISIAPERSFHTVSGFVLTAAGHLPQVGQSVEAQGWRWEVVDLDGLRIDKLLVSPLGLVIPPIARRPGSGALPR